MEPVELTTGGLLLRAWTEQDADAVHLACQDRLIQQWTTVPVPYLPEHAAEFVGPRATEAWTCGRAAPLGVFDAATGALLGSHGLVHLDLAAGIGEVGVWIAPWARGRGVAERATRAVARWALDVLPLRLLIWRAQTGNHASRLVAARVGFVFEAPARATITTRDGRLADAWRGTLQPGEIHEAPPAWYAPGGPGARRAHTFGTPQPTLPAGEVTLRPLTDEDTDGITSACADPDVARWTVVPVPYTRTDAVAYVRQQAPGMWTRGDGAVFAIAGPDGRYAGAIDLRISADDPETGSIGFLVAPHARGRGYATSAVRAICAWGFEHLGVSRIVWRAYVGNAASRRIAEKAGFVMEGVQRAGCVQRGERRDAWVAALLAAEGGRYLRVTRRD